MYDLTVLCRPLNLATGLYGEQMVVPAISGGNTYDIYSTDTCQTGAPWFWNRQVNANGPTLQSLHRSHQHSTWLVAVNNRSGVSLAQMCLLHFA